MVQHLREKYQATIPGSENMEAFINAIPQIDPSVHA
jgi:hypothetical protein